MDKYSVPKLIERIMVRPFEEFKKEIIRENDIANKEYLHSRTKDKEKLIDIQSYHRILEYLVVFIESDMKEIPQGCNLSIIRIIRPAIENYVEKGELPHTYLQVFE